MRVVMASHHLRCDPPREPIAFFYDLVRGSNKPYTDTREGDRDTVQLSQV